MLAPYGPDREGTYIKDSVGIQFQAFHITKESRKENQPFVTPSSAVLCWDGRLDNRAELLNGLRDFLTAEATDVEIVAVAYELWGTECFAKLIGDWALAIWSPSSRSVLLAKDFVGTRQLYYTIEKDQVTWSSILDPLVLLAEKKLALAEEYIAGWLSFFPATHLTPYVGIHSVPPSCFVHVDTGQHTIRKYWDFDSSKKLRYRTDREYERHFRCVFAEAVRRRLRSDSPILAELSGGMDSSSIVCMTDWILASGGAETPRVDTISYYDDAEPNWNERPYVEKVEEQRGRTGWHVNVNLIGAASSGPVRAQLIAPGASRLSGTCRDFAACLRTQTNRVVLSGMGGDEILGGVPSPVPELADLLASAHLTEFFRRLQRWSLAKRKPIFHLVAEVIREFLPIWLAGVPKYRCAPPWVNKTFLRRYRAALEGYETRLRLTGPWPSFQENVDTLDVIRRQLATRFPPSDPAYETRYPYLDRDLVEFAYSIPREQVVRPDQRRSLMRRALAGLVPDEVLNRKRKAFVVRGAITLAGLRSQHLSKEMMMASRGIVDVRAFRTALDHAKGGLEVNVIALLRTLEIEHWLGCWKSLEGSSGQVRTREKHNGSQTETPLGPRPFMEHT
jgi:asparagine synthase (glutamine-hydrolysing)